MKKILVSLAIIGAIILSSSLKANATTVRCYFYITLTDNCTPGGYQGNYCVQIKITYNGTVISSGVTNCNVTKGGPSCYTFDFDIPDQASEDLYGCVVVAAWRVGPSCITPGTSFGGNWSWSDITSCTEYLTVTVQ